MADWYYFQGGSQQGPVGDDQLRGMVASGQLAPSDSVWCNGMANWAPISSVPELAPASAPRGAPMGSAPTPSPGPEPAYQDDYDYAPRPSASGGAKRFTLWSIILVAGAGLWFLNAFMPWWGISVNVIEVKSKDDAEAIKNAGEIIEENRTWYQSHLSFDSYRRLSNIDGRGERRTASATLLGITTGTGLFAFIMSIFILGGVITSWFVGIIAPWRWTGSLFFALMGLILLILGIVWLFGPPGADAPPVLSQGNSLGPIIHLLATLAVLTGAVLDGIFGLLAFLKTLKKSPAM